MFNLVIKDISIQKKDKALYIFIFLNMLFIFVFQNNYGISMFLCFLSIYLVTMYANAYDFKYNSELMINSMPVNRKIVVSAKYLSVIIFFIIAEAIILVTGNLIQMVYPGLVTKTININTVFMEFFIVSIYYSIFFPLYFKMGYIKSRWFNFVIMGIMGSAITILGDISKGTNVLLQSSILVCISIILMLISLFFSIKIYSNKEF